MKTKNSLYQEAWRYIENAEEILRAKAGRDDGLYKDKKYVRMAGNTAWNGVLEAVDAWLESKEVKRPKKRPDFQWYQREISKINRKVNSNFVEAYNILHRFVGYDGTLSAKTIEAGLDHAHEVISLCDVGKK